MNKLLLTAVAACFSIAAAGSFAATAPDAKAGNEANPAGQTPSTDATRKQGPRPAKETKRTKDATSSSDAGPTGSTPSTDATRKQGPRPPKESKRKTPDPSSSSDAGGPTTGGGTAAKKAEKK
jgi:hypothetical protein